MIILVEGPRGSGKSHLIDNFFAQNKDDRFEYYKWDFAGWVEKLNLIDDGKSTHYFSIANIITILELGNSLYSDKALILDRSIFSAYVWALYRKRLVRISLITELNKILNRIYANCGLIYMNRDSRAGKFDRDKSDIFNRYENYKLEKQEFDELFRIFNSDITDTSRGNSMVIFNNTFDTKSQTEFNNLLYSFIDK